MVEKTGIKPSLEMDMSGCGGGKGKEPEEMHRRQGQHRRGNNGGPCAHPGVSVDELWVIINHILRVEEALHLCVGSTGTCPGADNVRCR